MKCITKRCRNEAEKGKRICSKCHSRWYKAAHPLKYTFNALRNNARRRGKFFTLTLEEFTQFCNETGYMEMKGKSPKSYSIDRIDSTKGYSIGNIQILTLAENTSKMNREKCPF